MIKKRHVILVEGLLIVMVIGFQTLFLWVGLNLGRTTIPPLTAFTIVITINALAGIITALK